jgi:hypothetical protein
MVSHGEIIPSFRPVRLGIQWCSGHQDRNIKFSAAICLQEASSTGDVSPSSPTPQAAQDFFRI